MRRDQWQPFAKKNAFHNWDTWIHWHIDELGSSGHGTDACAQQDPQRSRSTGVWPMDTAHKHMAPRQEETRNEHQTTSEPDLQGQDGRTRPRNSQAPWTMHSSGQRERARGQGRGEDRGGPAEGVKRSRPTEGRRQASRRNWTQSGPGTADR